MAKKFARIIIAIAGALIGLAAAAGADKLLAMMNRLPLHEAVYIAAPYPALIHGLYPAFQRQWAQRKPA